jgi:hypothetical protein
MYKTISNEIIRKFHPCYDPSEVIKDENEELPIKDWAQKYRDVVPANDIIWLLLRKEFLSEKDLRLFSVWCAREALKLIENPDERIVEACNVAEKYANGEATQEELHTAHAAAHDFADAAYFAVYVAYATSTDADAALAVANAASAASHASDTAYAADYAAADAAANASDAARAAQLDQLLTYFE